MAKYIITKTERYSVSADDPRIALNHFHIFYNNLNLSDFGLDNYSFDQDDFEYLDGTDSIEKEN